MRPSISSTRGVRWIGALVAAAFVAFQPGADAASSRLAVDQGAAATAGQVRTAIKDGWITMKVHAQFLPEDALEGSNVDVTTASGVVTLTGTVPNEAARAKAVAIAKATDGVKNVADKMRVGPAERAIDMSKLREAGRTTGRTITDGWVKSKIYAQFLTEDALDDSDIDIDIMAGAVTLNGTVKTEAGRARAVAIARATDGVKSVKDVLKVG